METIGWRAIVHIPWPDQPSNISPRPGQIPDGARLVLLYWRSAACKRQWLRTHQSLSGLVAGASGSSPLKPEADARAEVASWHGGMSQGLCQDEPVPVPWFDANLGGASGIACFYSLWAGIVWLRKRVIFEGRVRERNQRSRLLVSARCFFVGAVTSGTLTGQK